MTAACVRCGIRRKVNESRETNGMCRDCQTVEKDLASAPRATAQHGTESGYFAHIKQRHGWPRTACDPCLDAHRVAEDRRNRRRGIRPKAETMRRVHQERPQRRESNGRWTTAA